MELFYFNIVLTIGIVAIFWFIRVVYIPLLGQLPTEVLKNSAEKRRMQLIIILFPLLVFELATSIFLFFLTTQTDAYYYFAAAMLVQFIGLLTLFFLLKKTAEEYDKTGTEEMHKKLQNHHFLITGIWSFRFILIVLSLMAS